MKSALLIVLISSVLLAQEGCSIFKKGSSVSLAEDTPLKKEEVKRLKTQKITKDLSSIQAIHEGQEVTIQREGEHLKECPPFCIQPFVIENVITVGELETLEFIENLQKKKLGLMLDIRKNHLYQQATIPSAINLPLSMLDEESRYFERVLKLLGAKKLDQKWHFKKAQTLLVFGEGFMDSDASEMIQRLLKLNYPAEKLLYYRGGIQSWKLSGLTTY